MERVIEREGCRQRETEQESEGEKEREREYVSDRGGERERVRVRERSEEGEKCVRECVREVCVSSSLTPKSPPQYGRW